MTSRRRFLVLMGSAGVLAAGAATGISLLSDDDKAVAAEPTIAYGKEACTHCGMIIDDRRFAAAWIEPKGREVHFDDIGCLVEYREHATPPDGSRYFVHDFDHDAWLDAESATYAMSSDFHSPMAYGIAAFAGHEAAAHHEHAEVLAWGELAHHLDAKGGHQ